MLLEVLFKLHSKLVDNEEINWNDFKMIAKRNETFSDALQEITEKIPKLSQESQDKKLSDILVLLNNECRIIQKRSQTVLYKSGQDIIGLVTGASQQAIIHRKNFSQNVEKAQELIKKIRDLNNKLFSKDFQVNDEHKNLLKEIDENLREIYVESFDDRKSIKYLHDILREKLSSGSSQISAE